MGLFDKFKKEKTADAANGLYPDEPRDDFKTKDYYLGHLKRVDECLANIEHRQASDAAMSALSACINKDGYLFDKLRLLYVLRADAQELCDVALAYCRNMREMTAIDDAPTYNEVCRTLAFNVLFDFDPAEVEFLATPPKLQGLSEDAVSDLLRNALFNGQATTDKDFYYKDKGYFGDGKKDTGGLMQAISAPSPEERTAQFVEFLETEKEKHYKRLLKHYEEVGEDRYVYTGSFDFRLTALAKALGIPKDALLGSKFIAADLL